MEDLEEYRPIHDEDYELGKNKKGGGFLGKFIALLLGVLLGIIITVGGIVGAGYYAYTSVPVEDFLSAAKIENYEKYFGKEYAEKTIEDLVGDVSDLIGKENLCLGDLAKFSPYIRTLAEDLETTLSEYGVTITADELLSTPFNELYKFSINRLKSLSVGRVLLANYVEPSDFLLNLCFGEEHVDFEWVDGDIVMISDRKELTVEDLLEKEPYVLLQDIYLDQILPVDPNEDASVVLFAIAYGAEGTHYEVVWENGIKVIKMKEVLYTYEGVTLLDENQEPVTIYEAHDGVFEFVKGTKHLFARHDDDLPDGVYRIYPSLNASLDEAIYHQKRTLADLTDKDTDEIVYHLRVKDLINDVGDSIFLSAIQDWTIKDLTNQENFNNLKLSQILEISSSSPKILLALSDKTLGQLTQKDTIDNLYLSDVLDIRPESPKILQAIGGYKIGELTQRINELTVSDVLDEEQIENNLFLKHLKTCKITEIGTAISQLTVQQVFADTIYDSEGHLKGAWEYLLTKDGVDTECKLEDITTLVDNMQNNVAEASLSHLNVVLDLNLDSEFLMMVLLPIPREEAGIADTKIQIGNLTLSELSAYFLALTDYLQH